MPDTSGVNPYIPASAGQNLIGVHFPAARVNAIYEWAQTAVEDPAKRAEYLRGELEEARKSLVKMQDVNRTRVNTAEGELSPKDLLNAQLKMRGQDLDLAKANARSRLDAKEMAARQYSPPASLGKIGPDLMDRLKQARSVENLNNPETLKKVVSGALQAANLRSGGALTSASDSQKRAVGVEVVAALQGAGLSPDVLLDAESQLEGLLGVAPESLNPQAFEADRKAFEAEAMSGAQAGGRTKVDAVLEEALLRRQGEAKYVGGKEAEGALTPEEEAARDKYIAALSDSDTPGEVQTAEFASAEEYAKAKDAYDKARGAGAYSRAQRLMFDPAYLNTLKDVKGLERKVAQAEAGQALSPQEREQEIARLFRQRAQFIPGVRIEGADEEKPEARFSAAMKGVDPIFVELGPLVMQNLGSTRGGMDLRTPEASASKDPVQKAQYIAGEFFKQDKNQSPTLVLEQMRKMNVPEDAIRAGMVHFLSLKMVDKTKGTTMTFEGVPGTIPSAPLRKPTQGVLGAAAPGSEQAKRDALLNPVLFRDEAIEAQKARAAQAEADLAEERKALRVRTAATRGMNRFEARDLRRSSETPEGVFVRDFVEPLGQPGQEVLSPEDLAAMQQADIYGTDAEAARLERRLRAMRRGAR